MIVLLELLAVIKLKGQCIEFREISIGFDHRREHKKIVNQIKKSDVCGQEAGAKIEWIKELIEKIKFEIKLKLERQGSAYTHQTIIINLY